MFTIFVLCKIFLNLFTVAIYFNILYQYTFETLLFTGLAYILSIPISFFHYTRYKKKSSKEDDSLISDDFI